MLVLKMCQQFCPDKIPFVPTTRLGDGADGEIFDIKGQSDKVIKFGVLYETGSININQSFKCIKEVLSYFQANPAATYARVYSFGFMGKFERDIALKKKQPFILYFYTMEKLYKISEDEQKVFHSILSHEDRGINKNYSPIKINEMISGMSKGLDFNSERVTFFCDNFNNTAVSHLDIHIRNIMKDFNGNFKLVDFDRSEMRR